MTDDGAQRRATLKSSPIGAIYDAFEILSAKAMRTTVTLDDELVAEAKLLTGIEERSALLRAALTALIQRESARRLARLGGSDPDIKLAPRRRFG